MDFKRLGDKSKPFLDNIFNFIKIYSSKFAYILVGLIIIFATYVRTLNLPFLKDATTGKYISLALDPFLFQRYGQYLADNGSFLIPDVLRSAPLGADVPASLMLIPSINVFILKIINLFGSAATFDFVHVIHPVIFFFLSMIVFFLLVRKLFDNWTAVLATAFLSFIPSFLYRTTAGFSDKEPMGVFFMFLAFYFFVISWQATNVKSSIMLGLLSGLSTVLLWLTWGGVKFVFLIFGLYILVEYFLGKIEKTDVVSYSSWFLLTFLALTVALRESVKGFLTSITTGIAVFAFAVIIIDWFFFEKNLWKIGTKIKNIVSDKLPVSVLVSILSLVAAILAIILFMGPSALADIFNSISNGLLNLMQVGRVALTVAEQKQPFVVDWIGEFGALFFWTFFVGSIFLFYEMLKPLKKKRLLPTILYSIFLFAFIFSRYSSGSAKLNGTSSIAKFLYIGSLVSFVFLIVIFYLVAYYKKLKILDKISKIDKKYTFVFVWFLLMTVAARSAIRLVFIFSPIISIISAHLICSIFKKGILLKKNYMKILAVLFVVCLLVLPVSGTLLSFSKQTYERSKFTWPSYNIQWQYGMSWVRDNTPEDAVFAHWWDYGYWVQTGGERATVTDGGHNVGYWDYLIGRHVLTAQNETEALEFLNMHNTTHLLMINDEIGKYSAYSSIGSDENYDRLGWLSTFQLDVSKSTERREDTLLFYQGGFMLDEDLIWEGKVYPKQSAGIGAFLVPVVINEEGGSIAQPNAVVVYGNQQVQVPVKCIYVEGKEINFPGEGLGGCLKIIPRINGNQQEPLGALIYVSSKIKGTLFSDLFMFDKESEYFKLAYTDEDSSPMAIYQGRLIGPLKIWEITYPKDLKNKPEYIQTFFPEELAIVQG
ncbi:hypothetical protein HOB91_01300 [Candidatus Woesearchaeota archaeon]|jgi:asparagine N-glycosylation enzyme membrane subunit Stt3|nr:hypothetical protein [Candidatus Woesearchaeota archaeon]